MEIPVVVSICVAGALVLSVCGCVAVTMIIKTRDHRRRTDVELARLRSQYQAHSVAQGGGSTTGRNRLTKRPQLKPGIPTGFQSCRSSQHGSASRLLSDSDMGLLVRCVSDSSLFSEGHAPGLRNPSHPHSAGRVLIQTRNAPAKGAASTLQRLSCIVESPQGHPAFRVTNGAADSPPFPPPPLPSLTDDAAPHNQILQQAAQAAGQDASRSRNDALADPSQAGPTTPGKGAPKNNDGEEDSADDGHRRDNLMVPSSMHIQANGYENKIRPIEDEAAPVNGTVVVRRSPRITTPRDQDKIFSTHCLLDNGTDATEAEDTLNCSILNSPLQSVPDQKTDAVHTHDLALQKSQADAGLTLPRAPSRRDSVSDTGSPSERRRSSVLEPAMVFYRQALRSPRDAETESAGAGNGRLSPSRMQPLPKTSNLKGSPNARRGHRRQGAVRIVSKPTSIHVPRSRESSMPSVLEIDEASLVSPQRRDDPPPPRAQRFDPQLSVRPLSFGGSEYAQGGAVAVPDARGMLDGGASLLAVRRGLRRRDSYARSSASSLMSLSHWPTHSGTPISSDTVMQRPTLLQRDNSSSPTLPACDTYSPWSRADKSAGSSELSLQFPQLDFSPRKRKADHLAARSSTDSSPERRTVISTPPVFSPQAESPFISCRPCPLSSSIRPGTDVKLPVRNPTLNKPNLPPPAPLQAMGLHGPRDLPPSGVLKIVQSLRRQDSQVGPGHSSREEQRYRNLGRRPSPSPSPSPSAHDAACQPRFSIRASAILGDVDDKENSSAHRQVFWINDPMRASPDAMTPNWRTRNRSGGRNAAESPLSLYDETGFLKSTFAG